MLELNRVHHGNNLALMRQMPDNCIDAVVTDPPYGYKFMGKKWDARVPHFEEWEEVLRVLKPGGHLLSFAGTRTQHRMAVNIEDAGFEIRDLVMWVYGSGFPKSHNGPWGGTALKPAVEPITLARKPLDGTVAENVQQWGTGGLDIDGCRVSGEMWKAHRATGLARDKFFTNGPAEEIDKEPHALGRWPANLIHDGSDEVVGLFPGEEGESAARFFYVPKPSSGERDEGCEGLEEVLTMRYGEKAQGPLPQQTPSKPVAQRNHHPTVKPVELMEYLVRLISREGQIVLDPWGGSGTTGVACKILKRQFILMEREAEYVKIAEARIAAKRQMKLL